MYDVNGSNIGTIWGPALPPNTTDFSGMTNEYIGACTRSADSMQGWFTNSGMPCKCQQVFMSNTLSQMTCMVSFPSIGRQSVGVMQTQVCTAIHNVTMRL